MDKAMDEAFFKKLKETVFTCEPTRDFPGDYASFRNLGYDDDTIEWLYHHLDKDD
ncbi:MAG: hypothetical protein M0R80_01865 [Proteobacteria bacterium]|jgi:hypothetical protein|nr:hypothetical protein [Pseudomonadota bacterium]